MRIVHSSCTIEPNCDLVANDRAPSDSPHDQPVGPSPVALGDILMVELAEGVTLTGQVVWTTDDDCGVRFGEHVDCSALLTRLAACARQGSSLPVKLPLAAATAARRPNGLRRIEVMEVARRGLRLRQSDRFTDGLHVKVSVPGAPDRRGVVRWSQDNIARVVLDKSPSPAGRGPAMSLLL
jgi:hypothetical protein